MEEYEETFILENFDNGVALRGRCIKEVQKHGTNKYEYYDAIAKVTGDCVSGMIESYNDDISCGDICCDSKVFGYSVKVSVKPITEKSSLVFSKITNNKNKK